MRKTNKKRRERDDTVRIVARIHKVSKSLVKKVRNGERENEKILTTLIEYAQGKSNLIKHLESLVPIEPNPKRYARGQDEDRQTIAVNESDRAREGLDCDGEPARRKPHQTMSQVPGSRRRCNVETLLSHHRRTLTL